MKKYIIISRFDANDNNRGSAALGYGAVSFCYNFGYLKDGQELVNFRQVRKFWKKENHSNDKVFQINGRFWKHHEICVFVLEKFLYEKFHITLPFTKFGKTVQHIDLVASVYGGDGFSDIYGTKAFRDRLPETFLAIREKLPLIVLPQTLGPFEKKENLIIANSILKYATAIYVRDNKYIPELKKIGVKYELSKDLSAFMEPEPFNIEIKPYAIGLNVSGLAYSNCFRNLSGQFNEYSKLIMRIIKHFQNKGKTIYLIPHSYNYKHGESGNDDLIACRDVYEKLQNKKGIIVVDIDMSPSQVKFVISKMAFFIGTRMHANFAAIYTGVPVYGLAYSYKFEGAFYANGLDGKAQNSTINNITQDDIDGIVRKIDNVYNRLVTITNKESTTNGNK